MPRSTSTTQKLSSAEYKKRLNALLNLYDVYKDFVSLYLRDVSQAPGDMDVLYIRKLVPTIRRLVSELRIDMPDGYIPFETLSHAGKILREKGQSIEVARENMFAIYGDLKMLANRKRAVGQIPSPEIEAIKEEISNLFAIRYRNEGSGIPPKVSLADQTVAFDNDNAVLFVGTMRCPLPMLKYEHYFARAMWQRPMGEPVSWDIVVEEVACEIGREDLKEKAVMDTMYRLNNRIKDVVHTDDDLFSRKDQHIIRNYG